MKGERNYGRIVAIAICIMCAGCYSSHVNGTTVAPEQVCNRSWTAIVVNNTSRIYDLYVGTRIVGTADPNTTTRTVLDPKLGLVTPFLREAPATRMLKGPRIAMGALRMVCE